MSKLHKKCFLASAGMHVLLFLVLLVGPAFLMSRDMEKNRMPTLEIIPAKLIDDKVARKSAPTDQTKPAPPKPPQPQPTKPKPIVTQDPPKPQPKPDEKRWEPSTPKITTARRKEFKPEPKPNPPQVNQNAVEVASMIRKAAATPSIKISTPSGGGPAYANYAQAIRSIYEQNWHPPDETSRDDAVVRVQIVIAKDGTIRSSGIIGRSGDGGVDASVDATLRRVKKVPPFPAGAKESTRTYTIGFSLKAKRGRG